MTYRNIPVPDYIAFDLETTGLSVETDEILEVALVKFEGGAVVDRWSSLVRPTKPVPLKSLRLTHISRDDLERSPSLGEVLEIIQRYRRDFPLVGHNSQFDTAFLAKVIDGFPGVNVYDTLELSRIVFPGYKSYKLSDLAASLGVSLEEAHRAYGDAEASGHIFRLIQEKIGDLPYEVREKVLWVMGNKWIPGHLFSATGPEKSLQPALFPFSEPVPPTRGPGATPVPAASDILPDLTEALSEGREETVLDLPSGSDMARLVAGAVLEYTRKSKRRALMAGFPLTSQEVADMGARVSHLGLSSDYLCVLRFEKALFLAKKGLYEDLDHEEKRFLASLVNWRRFTQEGGSHEIQITGNGHNIWREVSCPQDLSCSESCPVREDCFYLKALRKASQSEIVLTTRLAALSPGEKYDDALIWGFHEIGRVWELREPRIDLGRLRDTLAKGGYRVAAQRTQQLLELLGRLVPQGDSICPSEVEESAKALYMDLSKVTSDMRDRFRDIWLSLDESGTAPPCIPEPPIVSANLHKLEYWQEGLRHFCSDDEASVRLVTAGIGEDGSKTWFLSRKTLWPAQKARAFLKERFSRVFYLSNLASLIIPKDGLRQLHGFSSPVILVKPGRPSAGTGFVQAGDEQSEGPGQGGSRQAACGDVLVAAADKYPVPGASQYASYVSGFLLELCQVIRKSCLVLFSSGALLKEVYSILAPRLEEKGIAVFAQGIDGGTRVVEHLEEDDTLVLARFGSEPDQWLASVPRCIVVPKVPFSPPSALEDLRRKEMFAQGRDGFIEINVHAAVLAIRSYIQAMSETGRRSAVIFLDPKVLPGQRGWGKSFMEEFSDFRRVVSPPKEVILRVVKWLAEGPER
ncbi:MAG TPA: hypothetical protein GXX30_01480 [Firmicutes bacterium]|nr:hypothetical protein [Candidatus Fermentithermobacillaceae bacterium]